MFTLAALAAMTAASAPIQMSVSREGDLTTFVVQGASAVPLTARYELEVLSGAGNRNRNVGTVSLRPGAPQRFATIRVSAGQYVARLVVTDEGGRVLGEQVLRSPG